jgi:hypothetical protein
MSHLLHRREILRIGAISILAGPAKAIANASGAATRRRNCIFLLLQGGPSHLDLWDPKPDAPQEVRGPFRTVPTRVPGLRFGELLEKSAAVADRLCVVRSVSHKFTNHIAGTYITLTGSTSQPDQDREAVGDDFPGPGAILNFLERETPSIPRSISLPNWLSIPGPSNRMPGQFAGFLGSLHDPFLVEGEPGDPSFHPLSLSLPDEVTPNRLRNRLSLLAGLDRLGASLEKELNARQDHLRQSAYDLVISGRLREALQLWREPDSVRDRYGRNKLGQSLLLARRLVEAGVQFVAYNEFNQKWDTHGNLLPRYQQIIPPMDQGFSALVEDLAQRGLLDDTMVVNAGEFGRTPRMNQQGGRDHWPNVYSVVLAGGGVRGGHVYGSSDNLGSEVLSQAVSPADILATLWQQLGIPPDTEIHDRLNRPYKISSGTVIQDLL